MLEILSFFQESLPPAKIMTVELMAVRDNLPEELKREATFEFIDVASLPQRAELLQVEALPTILFLENGTEKERLTGYYPQEELMTRIKTILAAAENG